MTDVTTNPREQKSIDKRLQRQNAFYDQTIDENNARLDAKLPAGDVRDEIKFIQSQLLAIGPP